MRIQERPKALSEVEAQGISVMEFARRVGLGRTRVYSEIKAKNIQILKSGRRTIVPVSEVEAFFKRLGFIQSQPGEKR